MIYRLWIIADKLRDSGHFFAITGRSAILRVIGNSKRLAATSDYNSPDVMIQIPLPPLSKSSILTILKTKQKTCTNIKTDDKFIDRVYDYTLGIPRAIYAVLHYFIISNQTEVTKSNSEENEDHLFEGIAVQIKNFCQVETCKEADIGLFYKLLEMSWAEFEIS